MKLSLLLAPYETKNIQDELAGNYISQAIRDMKVPEYWRAGYRGQNVTIAVMDTGCQCNHPDLKYNIIGGKNFTKEDRGNSNVYEDYNGHGTHVAGIIAAKGNGTGMVGVAPESKLLILKVMNGKGRGSYTSLIKAIEYAIENKVNIICLSLGGKEDLPALHQVIKKAMASGIIIVCAASNDINDNAGTIGYVYPGYYNESIAVGAQMGTQVAPFSNKQAKVDLVAPGVEVVSCYIHSKYARLSGTSMAAPHIAGVIALLMNWGKSYFGRDLTPMEIYAQLIKRTVSLGFPSTQEGNGKVYLTLNEKLNELRKQGRLN